MKKSALKEAIKNEIKSVLTENQMTTDEAFKILRNIHKQIFHDDRMDSDYQLMGQALDALQAGEITKMMDRERGINEGIWSTGTYNEIGRFIQEIKNLKDKYYNIVGSDDVYDGLDQAESAAREIMINAPENRSDINEDEEPTAADLKKKDSITSTANKLQKLVKQMKDKAKEYKEAEGGNKEKIKAELKKMTAEKKQLEKDI